MPRVTALRIVFDKNVPVGVRRFLSKHEVRTFAQMHWHPQLENGELLSMAEAAGFDVMVTSDQNIRHQQNLTAGISPWLCSAQISGLWCVITDRR
jgi:hypothetical protein